MKGKLAVIDIGTNTIKLLVCRWPLSIHGRCLEFRQETVRLGAELTYGGLISPPAVNKAAAVVARFLAVIRKQGCRRFAAYGTHPFRRAGNGRQAARTISEKTGVQVLVLEPEQEARYAVLSARHRGLLGEDPSLIVDIGGGSTECICSQGGHALRVLSFPLGALHLSERFLRSDPPSRRDVAALRRHISVELRTLHRRLGRPRHPLELIASGGTASTLLRMAAGEWAGGERIDTSGLTRILSLCLSLPLAARKRLPGLEPARADIIAAGLVVLERFVDYTWADEITVNDGGVREGVLLALGRGEIKGQDETADLP